VRDDGYGGVLSGYYAGELTMISTLRIFLSLALSTSFSAG
jgi:hypothetical protein